MREAKKLNKNTEQKNRDKNKSLSSELSRLCSQNGFSVYSFYLFYVVVYAALIEMKLQKC